MTQWANIEWLHYMLLAMLVKDRSELADSVLALIPPGFRQV